MTINQEIRRTNVRVSTGRAKKTTVSVKLRRALVVLSSQEIVECTRLSARLSLGACTRRYVLAQSSTTRAASDWNRNGRSMENEPLVSCRNCKTGRQRTHNQEVIN